MFFCYQEHVLFAESTRDPLEHHKFFFKLCPLPASLIMHLIPIWLHHHALVQYLITISCLAYMYMPPQPTIQIHCFYIEDLTSESH